MPKEKKENTVKEIEEFLSGSTAAIVTDYRGMSVTEISQLRNQLKNAKVEYHVVKNTLASLAAERVGKEELKEFLKGPTAIAFSYGEVTEPSKIIVEYIRTSKTLTENHIAIWLNVCDHWRIRIVLIITS